MKSSMMGHVVDMAGLKMVQPPGLRSPKQRVTYASTEVQEHLCLAFGGILPWMQVIDDDHVRYLWDEGDGRDTCAESLPVESMGAIPKGEMLRLMEGWIMLRKLAQNPNLPPGMDAILLNFRIPDPRHAPEFYRVYRCAKTGRQRMHVLWGFEAPKKPSVLVDRAVAAQFGVPVENIGSILATSFAAHGTTGSIPVAATRRTTASQIPLDPAPATKGGIPRAWIAAGLGVALVGGGGVWAGISMSAGRSDMTADGATGGAAETSTKQTRELAPLQSTVDSMTPPQGRVARELSPEPSSLVTVDGLLAKASETVSPPRSGPVGIDAMMLSGSPVPEGSRTGAPVSLNRMLLSNPPADTR